MSRNKTIIYGATGFNNIGDEAILKALLKNLNNEVIVFSSHPAYTKLFHRGIKVVRPNILDLLQSHTVIIGGGGILFDTIAKKFLLCGLIAKIFGNKVVYYAVGADEPNSVFLKFLLIMAINIADEVSVRDAKSKFILRSIGIKKEIKIIKDPAMQIVPIPREKALATLCQEGIPTNKPIIALSLSYLLDKNKGMIKKRENKLFAENIRKTIYWLQSEYDVTILFIPMFKHPKSPANNDELFFTELIQGVKNEIFILQKRYMPDEIAGIIACCTLLIGMRLHSIIFAFKSHVPIIAIANDDKVRRFADEKGITRLDIASFNVDRLKICIKPYLKNLSIIPQINTKNLINRPRNVEFKF